MNDPLVRTGSGTTAGLPVGVALTRTTATFTHDSTPAGLLRAHRVASNVWGVLRLQAGGLRFVWEPSGESVALQAGEHLVIPPDVFHHVEPDEDAVFCVEFYQ